MLEYQSDEWGYRTLPNKMYELVKNSGDMHKTGTGYFTDAESEMITILEYLNHGVKTNITESMIEQIENAIKDSLNKTLAHDTDYVYSEKNTTITLQTLVNDLIEYAKIDVCVIRFDNEDYMLQIKTPDRVDKHIHYRTTLQECREYAWSRGFRVKYSKTSVDQSDIVEIWI